MTLVFSLLVADYINIFLTYTSIQNKKMFIISRMKSNCKISDIGSPEQFKIALEFLNKLERAGGIFTW